MKDAIALLQPIVPSADSPRPAVLNPSKVIDWVYHGIYIFYDWDRAGIGVRRHR